LCNAPMVGTSATLRPRLTRVNARSRAVIERATWSLCVMHLTFHAGCLGRPEFQRAGKLTEPPRGRHGRAGPAATLTAIRRSAMIASLQGDPRQGAEKPLGQVIGSAEILRT